MEAFVIILATKDMKDRIQEQALKKKLTLSDFCLSIIEKEMSRKL